MITVLGLMLRGKYIYLYIYFDKKLYHKRPQWTFKKMVRQIDLFDKINGLLKILGFYILCAQEPKEKLNILS